MERDLLTGMSIPHLSFILRHFLPMAYNCSNRQIIQDEVVHRWGSFDGVETEFLVSGSSKEGINLPVQIHCPPGSSSDDWEMKSSDLDIMLILKNKVVGDPKIAQEQLGMDRNDVMEIFTAGIHPGYLQIRVHKSASISHRDMYVEKGQDNYLYYAPEKIKDMLRKEHPALIKSVPDVTFDLQGPALNVLNPASDILPLATSETDLVFPVFCCPVWPKVAEKWKTRHRHGRWPSSDLIEEITEKGCHIVPVCHTNSREPDLEWRWSFSVAELMLMRNINRTQRQCYLLLKTLHSQELKEPKALVTYHMKTLFLWMCERIPAEEWNPDNVGPCLLIMLDHLHKCLQRRHLPSYFVPENNLIDRIEPELCQNLASSVIQIRADPLKYLFRFNKKWKWFFGLLYVDADELFQPVLDDARTSSSLRESYENVFLMKGLTIAVQHLQEHGALMAHEMRINNNPDPGDKSYTLPYDNALDIMEDLVRFHLKIIGELLDISQVVLLETGNLSEYTDCLIGFYERVIERHPHSYIKNAVMLGNLGCCYHVKFLRPLSNHRKKEIQDRTSQVFEQCMVSGGSTACLLDYALFLCAAKEENTAVAILHNMLETEAANIIAGKVGMNVYSGSELTTLDQSVRQISEAQKMVSTYSYAMAAYLLVKLETDEREKMEIIQEFKIQCQTLMKFKEQNLIEVGNAFVLLGYACEVAGHLDDAKEAQSSAKDLLPAKILPVLHALV